MLTLRSAPSKITERRRSRFLFIPRFLLQKGGLPVRPSEGKHPCEDELSFSFMWLYPNASWTKDERLQLARYVLHTHFRHISTAALTEAIKQLSNFSAEDALFHSPQQLITSRLDKLTGTPWKTALITGARLLQQGDGIGLHPYVEQTLAGMTQEELKQLGV